MLLRISSGLTVLLLLGCASSQAASSSICDPIAGNLILNCGFEANGTTVLDPSDWTVDAGYTSQTGFNHVQNGVVNSGGFALQIGNDDNQGPAGIFQTFSDVSGDTYTATFFADYGGFVTGDIGAFLKATIDSTVDFTLTGCNDGCSTRASASYAEYQFTFTGSGSDTLGFEAQTNPSEWFVDDINVVDTSAGTAPEPASLLLMAGGLVSLVALARRRRLAA